MTPKGPPVTECSSTYHRFYCSFVSTELDGIISCTGPRADDFKCYWKEVGSLTSSRQRLARLNSHWSPVERDGPPMRKSFIHVEAIHEGRLALYQVEKDSTTFGILLRHDDGSQSEFDDFFASLLLAKLRYFTLPPAPPGQGESSSADSAAGLDANHTTTAIVDLFDKHLRYVGAGDKWDSHGRTHFQGLVHEFVRRGTRVEFCLPAFPCKSSNQDKVQGVMPDRGEQLALEHLHSFVEAIENVYKPGATLWVVSDGHVFSDCSKLSRQLCHRTTS